MNQPLMTRMGRFRTNVLLLIAALLLIPGCSSVSSPMSGMAWFGKKDEELVFATAREPAAEIVCVWQPARGKGLNGVPTRGVGGQLMFFTRSKATPVAVEGDVRIYLFDNQGTVQEQSQPIHQFDFPAEQWSSYLAIGNLGPSYNVFIPYTRGGHKQVECTLQVQFRPKDGSMVYSDLASLTLPGVLEDSTAQRKTDQAAQQAAELTAAVRANRKSAPGLKVKTIDPKADMKATREKMASQLSEEAASLEQQLQALHREAADEQPASGKIQQVSAEVEQPVEQPQSPEAERIERLERMLEELLRQKKADAEKEDAPAARATVSQVSHADLEFLPPQQVAATPHRWEEYDFADAEPAELQTADEGWALPLTVADVSPTSRPRTKHPLSLDEAEVRKSGSKQAKQVQSREAAANTPSRKKRHPLSDWE